MVFYVIYRNFDTIVLYNTTITNWFLVNVKKLFFYKLICNVDFMSSCTSEEIQVNKPIIRFIVFKTFEVTTIFVHVMCAEIIIYTITVGHIVKRYKTTVLLFKTTGSKPLSHTGTTLFV